MNSAVNVSIKPDILNLGGSADYHESALNVSRHDRTGVDAVFDIEAFHPASIDRLESLRFGIVRIAEGCFERIVARHVLQQVANLTAALEACLYLLKDGGTLDLVVPYDLSFGAWSDPQNVRAFNEQTFKSVCEKMMLDETRNARFELASMSFIPSAYGMELSKTGRPVEDVARQPRAVDALAVSLRKIAVSSVQRPYTNDENATVSAPSPFKASARAVSPPPPVKPSPPRQLTPFAGGWDAHKDAHCIWIVTPPGYIHSLAFAEVAYTLQCAFEALGGSAPLVTDVADWGGRSPIVFGASLLPPDAVKALPADSVIVNLEQVLPGSEWMNDDYIRFLQTFPTLDYSERNRLAIARLGIPHVRTLEIGYCPQLTRIEHAPVKDIDVLFYGSMNQRRADVLQALKNRGLNVVHLFAVYGAERDAAIGRAKVVINLHHYENGVFEIVRVSYLLANRVCVLTEGSPDDPEILPLAGGVDVVAYEELVERCVDLVRDDDRREKLAEEGFRLMSSRSQAAFLKALIEQV